MHIITRGDFDGLACSVLLNSIENIDEIRFAHPKDAQDGKIKANSNDIVVNMPYIPGCGLWFDHHTSEQDSLPAQFPGRFEMAPSCARVIYNYYLNQHRDTLKQFTEMVDATDRLDSGNLTHDEVLNPSGWILLGLTLDPRSGLGSEFRRYFQWLAKALTRQELDAVLLQPEVKNRTDRVLDEQKQFMNLLKQNSNLDGNIIFVDFRHLPVRDIPVGNRFLSYTMYPEANVELRVFNGPPGIVVAAVGHSIFNRTCPVNVGLLLKKYGGGGHFGAGTCQIPIAKAEDLIATLKNELRSESGKI